MFQPCSKCAADVGGRRVRNAAVWPHRGQRVPRARRGRRVGDTHTKTMRRGSAARLAGMLWDLCSVVKLMLPLGLAVPGGCHTAWRWCPTLAPRPRWRWAVGAPRGSSLCCTREQSSQPQLMSGQGGRVPCLWPVVPYLGEKRLTSFSWHCFLWLAVHSLPPASQRQEGATKVEIACWNSLAEGAVKRLLIPFFVCVFKVVSAATLW